MRGSEGRKPGACTPVRVVDAGDAVPVRSGKGPLVADNVQPVIVYCRERSKRLLCALCPESREARAAGHAPLSPVDTTKLAFSPEAMTAIELARADVL